MKKILSVIVSSVALFQTTYAQNDIVNAEMMRNDFNNFARAEDSRFITAGSIPSFTPKEETVGTRYLFDRWVHGSVVSIVDSVYSDPNTLFNYNKAAGTLLMTKDKKSAIELYLNKIKSFTLSDEKTYHFERVDIINDKDFFMTLVKGDKYSLYKLLKTKFIAANYSTNGIIETGNKYDEYRDVATYYLVLPGGKEFKTVELKRKSVKTALGNDGSKMDKYMNETSQTVIDEPFLVGLVSSLNQ